MNFAGWVIAICQGRAFVGRETWPESDNGPPARVLSPVFDLQSGIQLRETPQGPAVSRPCIAAPVLGFASIKSLAIPAGAIILAVEDLTSEERGAIAQAVTMGAQIQASMRAGDAGVVLAPADVKLPPLKERG